MFGYFNQVVFARERSFQQCWWITLNKRFGDIEDRMNYIRRLSGDTAGIYRLSDGDPEFVVKYLGVVLLRGETFKQDLGKYLCNAAVEKLFKDSQLRPKKVTLTISCDLERGLRVVDPVTKAELVFTLQSIAFCCIDKDRPKVFSFLAEVKGALQCHVFKSEREDKARLMTLTIANAFQEAFSKWDRSQKKAEREHGRRISYGFSQLHESLKEVEEPGKKNACLYTLQQVRAGIHNTLQ